MELVPIVVLALKIVSVFAVVVLLASYIAFKIRAKSEPAKREFADEMKPKFVGKGIKRLTMMTKEILPAAKPSASSSQPKYIQQKEKTAQYPNGNPNTRQSNKAGLQQREKPRKKTEKPIEPTRSNEQKVSPRLEIIKQMPGVPESKQGKKDKDNENLNSLGDEILNKYMDDDDDSLYSLNTDNNDPED